MNHLARRPIMRPQRDSHRCRYCRALFGLASVGAVMAARAALLSQPIQTQLITEHWNDLLRLIGSMKSGHTTASLLIAKLHASSRQSSLAKALHEYGRLIRTIYVCLMWNLGSCQAVPDVPSACSASSSMRTGRCRVLDRVAGADLFHLG